MKMILKRKYVVGNETDKLVGRAGGARGHGAYKTRTGNSHGVTGSKWNKHTKHPVGMSGRALSSKGQ